MKRPEPTAPASSELSLEKHAAVSMEDCRIHDLRTHCSRARSTKWILLSYCARTSSRARMRSAGIAPLSSRIEAIPEDICSR